MLIKCPQCETIFDEKLNICPVCGRERHVLSLAQKNEIEKAELLKAEVKRLEIEKQEEEGAARMGEEYKKAAPERRAREKAAAEQLTLGRAARPEVERREKEAGARVEKEAAGRVAKEAPVSLEFGKKEEARIGRGKESNKKVEPEKFVNSFEVEKKLLPKEKSKLPKKKIGKKLLVSGLVLFLVAGIGTFLTWKIITKASQINVVISSVPVGAEVYWDKVATGLKTAATLKNVKIGEHALTLEREGYANLVATISVVVKSNMQQPAPFQLLRKVIPPLKIAVTPLTTGVRTMLPIRPIVEAIGGTVAWVVPNKEAQIIANGIIINLWIGKNQVNVAGLNKLLDPTNLSVVPSLVEGRTLLPIKFINEQLGLTVTWDEATKEAKIQFKN